MMDPMLSKPKNHKRRNPWPTILMLGVAIVCYVLAARGYGTVTQVVLQP